MTESVRWRRQQTPVLAVTNAIQALIALGLAAPLKRPGSGRRVRRGNIIGRKEWPASHPVERRRVD
jgi:hypothetical protein